MDTRSDHWLRDYRLFGCGRAVVVLLALLASCTENTSPPPVATGARDRKRQFMMAIRVPGEEPADLSDHVRNPKFVVAYPAADAALRAEVHGSGSRVQAETVAREIYTSAVEVGRILGVQPRGALVLHLVALPKVPSSYRFEVSYKEGDPGMTYLFETAHFYVDGDEPLKERGVGSLRATIYHTLPHEIAHDVCSPALAYHPSRVDLNRLGSMQFKAPRWLDDGIADFVGNRIQAKLAPDLDPPYSRETGKRILRSLGTTYLDWPDAGHSNADWKGFPAADHYAAAFVLVDALVEGDEQKLRDLLRGTEQSKLRDESDLRELIRKHFKTDPESLIRSLSSP